MNKKKNRNLILYLVLFLIFLGLIKGVWNLLSIYVLKNQVGYCQVTSINKERINYKCFMGNKVDFSFIDKKDEVDIKHLKKNSMYVLVYNSVTYEYSVFWFCKIDSSNVIKNMDIEVARECIDLKYFLTP